VAIGYALQQSLQNELYQRGIKKNVATVITQTLVDRNDPAFLKPSKPIGGKQALITNPENIGRALKGETGAWIVPD
jgi:carbamate kinase